MRPFDSLPRKEKIRLLNIYLTLAVREFEKKPYPKFNGKKLDLYDCAVMAGGSKKVTRADFDLIKNMTQEDIYNELIKEN